MNWMPSGPEHTNGGSATRRVPTPLGTVGLVLSRNPSAKLSLQVAALLLVCSLLLLALLFGVSKAFFGHFSALDWKILLALRDPADVTDPLGGPRFEGYSLAVGSLGSAPVVTLLTLAAIGYFVVIRRRDLAVTLCTAVGSAVIATTAIKHLVERPGLNLSLLLYSTPDYSFPSGHSALSSALYLTLAALLAGAGFDRRTEHYCLGLAMLATLIIGLSRIYTGVHFPTDVLAGWAIGAASTLVAVMGWLYFRSVD